MSLCHSVSLNQPSEIDNNDPIFKLISSYDDIEYILKNKKENIFKFLYFNKNQVQQILYESDKIITITSDILLKNDLSYYFYLNVLLNYNTDTVDYQYSKEEIKTVNNQLKYEKNEEIQNFMKSKIITSLTSNYRQFDDYDEEEDEKDLETIKTTNKIDINKLKELNLISEDNIENNENIDDIYIDIINSLIENDNLSNYEYYIKIMEQIDLENIDIIKSIYDKLSKILDINSKYITKYKISDINDLLNEKIINFYFILFKYILKNTLYLYHIPLLLKSRTNILKTIKINSQSISNTVIKDNYNKFKYIIDFFTDSKYYEKYLDYIINNTEQSEQDKSVKNNNSSISSQISKPNISTKSKTKQNQKQNLNVPPGGVDIYKIIIYEKNIEIPKNNYNKLRFIKELSNGYFIIGAPGDFLYIYDQNYTFQKKIDIKILKEDIQKLSSKANTNKLLSNKDNEITKKFFIRNIIETNYSKNNKKNKFEINICSKLVFTQYSFDFQNNDNNNKLNYSKIIIIPANGYFEINVKNYILYGEKGLFHFNKEPFNLNISNLQDMEEYRKDKRNYIGGVILDNNLIALTSNKVLLPNGEDIIIFYDIINQKIINKANNYSFVNGINGLVFINLEENKKILLCACKKYMENQKNGILLINADIREKEEIILDFLEIEEFEVNCLCPIQTIKSGNNYKNNYFLAGGLDIEKKRGAIKLCKIVFKNETEMNIEFLQDIFFEDDYNKGFEGPINCIVQSKKNGKILASCADNNIYLFSKPDIELYLNEYI